MAWRYVKICRVTRKNQTPKCERQCERTLRSSEVRNVVLQIHSEDTDIKIVAASLATHNAYRMFINYNTGDNRKVLCLGDLESSDLEKISLIGIHSFAGNDYASSFFRRSKRFWIVIKINPKFCSTLSDLSSTWISSNQVQKELEKFVCLLYGSKRLEVRDFRAIVWGERESEWSFFVTTMSRQSLNTYVKIFLYCLKISFTRGT